MTVNFEITIVEQGVLVVSIFQINVGNMIQNMYMYRFVYVYIA